MPELKFRTVTKVHLGLIPNNLSPVMQKEYEEFLLFKRNQQIPARNTVIPAQPNPARLSHKIVSQLANDEDDNQSIQSSRSNRSSRSQVNVIDVAAQIGNALANALGNSQNNLSTNDPLWSKISPTPVIS